MRKLGPFQFSEVAPFSRRSPKQLVIFLHGYGARGQNLIGLASEFAAILPDAHFISPNAAYECEMGEYDTYQWFSIAASSQQEIAGYIERGNELLENFINDQLGRFNLTEKDLVLVGFSQGAMMSIHNALRRKNRVAGVIAYSGRLLFPDALSSEICSRPKICLIHGELDQVVPFTYMDEAFTVLKNAKIDVTAHPIADLEHSINMEGIKIAMQFLADIFRI